MDNSNEKPYFFDPCCNVFSTAVAALKLGYTWIDSEPDMTIPQEVKKNLSTIFILLFC
jgi:hypothetical protein